MRSLGTTVHLSVCKITAEEGLYMLRYHSFTSGIEALRHSSAKVGVTAGGQAFTLRSLHQSHTADVATRRRFTRS